MKIRLTLGLLLLLQFHLTSGQGITLNDLVYFQATKDPIKIDSVLLTKKKWDCNCYRNDGHIDWVKNWIYDIADTTKENVDKDYIKIDNVGQGFSSIVAFYTTDKKG